MTIMEEQFDREHAEEICVIGSTLGEPDTILILDTFSEPAQELDKNTARALAVRLLTLAEDLPDPPRILLRASDVDSRPRALDD